MDNQEYKISWDFPEFEIPERSKSWYLWAILVGVVVLIISVTTSNFLFGLIIILAGVVMFAQHHKDASQVIFGITEDGVIAGDKFFNFKDLKHFWIVYEPPRIKNLYFEFNNPIKPRLTIPLQDVNPVKVRKILLEFLEEDSEREAEPLSEMIGKRLKI